MNKTKFWKFGLEKTHGFTKVIKKCLHYRYISVKIDLLQVFMGLSFG